MNGYQVPSKEWSKKILALFREAGARIDVLCTYLHHPMLYGQSIHITEVVMWSMEANNDFLPIYFISFFRVCLFCFKRSKLITRIVSDISN